MKGEPVVGRKYVIRNWDTVGHWENVPLIFLRYNIGREEYWFEHPNGETGWIQKCFLSKLEQVGYANEEFVD